PFHDGNAPRPGQASGGSPWAPSGPQPSERLETSNAAQAAHAPVMTPSVPPSSAAHEGAYAASNAAALSRNTSRPGTAPFARGLPSAGTPRDVVELLWYEPAALPRVRAWFADMIADLEFEPLDPRYELPAGDAQLAADRHTVFGVLTEA